MNALCNRLTRKGISPLIATILIIGFTVALAAVIMTWGQSFVKVMTKGTEANTEKQLACSKVLFTITDACADIPVEEVQITISNEGNQKIESFIIRIHSQPGNMAVTDFNVNSLDPFGIKTAYEPFPDTAEVRLIEAIPTVNVLGEMVTCGGSLAFFGDQDLVNGELIRNC